MTLNENHSAEEKQRWKIVRTDNFTDVDCEEIISADESSGECKLKVKGKIEAHWFPGGIRIVRAR